MSLAGSSNAEARWSGAHCRRRRRGSGLSGVAQTKSRGVLLPPMICVLVSLCALTRCMYTSRQGKD